MADPGLMGVGAGLSSFADTYLKSKQMQQNNDINQRYADIAAKRENAGLLQNGMQSDDDNNVSFTQAAQHLHDTKMKLDQGGYDSELQKQDPTSPMSNAIRAVHKANLKEDPSTSYLADQIPDSMPGKDIEDIFGNTAELAQSKQKQASAERIWKDRLEGMKEINEDKISGNQEAIDKKLQAQSDLNDKKLQSQADLYSQKQKEAQEELDKKLAAQSAENDKKYAAQLALQKQKTQGKSAKPNPAYAALDKDFAKDWNTYTSGGRATVDQNLDRLEQAKQYLMDNPDATGPARGLLPDSVRSFTNPDAVKTKQDVHASVIGGLKGAMGGRVTQNELNFFTNLAWNDQLPAKDNADKIDQVIQKIKTERENTEQKGQQFERYGTLSGMKMSQPQGSSYSTQPRGGLIPKNSGKSSKGPQIGSVEGGHVYLGGNPGNPKSWAPVNGGQ